MNLLCQSCGAALELAASDRSSVCPYCDSPNVLERPPAPDRPNPSLVIGFQVGREDAHQKVRAFLRKRRLFARSGIEKAELGDVRGVYAPAYLYGAVARVDYAAQIGEHYWENVTVGSGKNRRTERRRRTEWRHLRGNLATYVTDRVVTASRGIDNAELEKVEPFDLRLVARYRPAAIAGWIAEDPSMPASECAALARKEALAEIDHRLDQFMPGDEHRDVQHQTALEEESLDLSLVPLWVFAARYAKDRPPMRILVNGQTGKTWGKVPLSWVKITLTVVLVAALIAGVVLFVQSGGAQRLLEAMP